MTFILSLIGERTDPQLSHALLNRVNSICKSVGDFSGQWRWLEPQVAAECDLSASHAETLLAVRQAIQSLPIDVNVVASQERRKRLLICDMDATAITGETLDDLSTFTPYKAEIDALTRKSVEGSMSFEETLLARVEMMRGLDRGAFDRAHALVKPSPGVRTLVATMREHGALTALVSGGFRYFTSRVRAKLGFDIDISNELEFSEGRATGRLCAPIVGPEAKARAVSDLAAEIDTAPSQTLAVGDGSNDIPMLRAAGLGVAYRGKAKVRAAIAHQINYADLTAILFLQGYHRDEFCVREDLARP